MMEKLMKKPYGTLYGIGVGPGDPELMTVKAIQVLKGVDVVFTPSAADMYPEGADTQVCQKRLPAHLCGLSRPGHFTGVLTVVAKLFHIITPHSAVFGQKDWQQMAIIKKMAKDLNFNVNIVGLPTVREHDGLAMSSRNARLDPGLREAARSLYRSLARAREQVREGKVRTSALIRSAEMEIKQYPENRIDYIRICHPDTLDDVTDIEGPALMALAAFVGGVRLIDNIMLQPADEPTEQKAVNGIDS